MPDPATRPSDHLLDVLAYTAGLRMLLDAKDRGTLTDSEAPERELRRIERAVAHVLNAIVGPVPG